MKQQGYAQIFQRDPNYNGPHIVQTYLKKEKSSASYKFFSDQNTRFFTLNMQNFQFYYTPKDQYQSKDIKYIDIENLKYVVDRGCYKNKKGQNKEWTYQFIMYFTNKYTVIYCQNEIMKQLWLNAFKNIIRISDKKRLFYTGDTNEVNLNVIDSIKDNSVDSKSQTQEINRENRIDSNSINNTNNIQSSLNSQVEQKKAKNNLDSQEQINSQHDSRRNSNDSFNSNDSLGRKKRKSQFQEVKKRVFSSSYKRKQNADQFWNNKVIPLLRQKLQQVRNKIKRIKENQQSQMENQQQNLISKQQENELKEKQTQKSEEKLQPAKQKEDSEQQEAILEGNNKFNNINEVEIFNLEASNIQGSNINSEVKIFRKSDEKNSQKKSHKNSYQKSEGSGRKHKVNIFENVYQNGDQEDDAPTLNIQFQQKKSQNGWDGNDVDLLQNILRENSDQLKENNNDNFQDNQIQVKEQKQQEQQFNRSQLKSEDIQEVSIFKQEVQQKNKEPSKMKQLNDYDDWDVDLDNTPTPAIAGNKKNNLQQFQNQTYNNTNNSLVYQNKNQTNNTHSLNQYFTSNNKSYTNQETYQQPFQKSQAQQNQQLNVIENDYDNWDDDM
ncbi:hypothetical protein TTHERM_00786910 (macronuclear) [Tetrahymena thermophila SB210]|uniref:PH domain-containing protein n=1 Tax=Tetrahymena thermophila (strain SB210) TaxID=312017 RepID=Q23ZH2_TETTS|nr:hypothetical protein TTHERM_00786910 [Tetrahymena thermophila SB210]EAS01885.2 hypothetical protein TTHERM_00786910 [Tetrahymena thermophila SB210]|eukprot:XP_001022130.2 hypothetical protein TTHERM_00786910 [Tetrahymena thermophila SB210]